MDRARLLNSLRNIACNSANSAASCSTGNDSFLDRRRPSASPSTSSTSSSSIQSNPNRRVSFGMVLNHYRGASDNEDNETNAEDEDADDDSISAADVQPVNRAMRPRINVEQESDDADEENNNHEVVLSLFWKGSKLGGAIYSGETSEVFILADVPDLAPHFNLTTSFITQTGPSQIVTCGRLTEGFVTILKDYCSTAGKNDDDNSKNYCRLHFIPNNELKPDFVKARILALRLPCEPEGSRKDDQSHLDYVHSLIDLNNDCSVFALGALLKFLDKNWSTLNLEIGDQSAPIVAVKRISLSEMVCIDVETMTALQIFSGHINPNNIAKSRTTAVTEGLSLFALFNRCKSTMGCKYLRMMMLKPTHNKEVLNERLELIEFCNDQSNKDFMGKILNQMRNVKGVMRIMTKLKSAQPSVKDWKSLVKTIYNVVVIGEMCSSKADEVPLFQKIRDSMSDELYRIGQSINTIMDMEESEKIKRFVVSPGIDTNLDSKKQEYNGMQDLLTSVAQLELDDLPPMIGQCTVNYVPEMGYMLAVPLWDDNLNEEDVQLPNLQLLFVANAVAHFKTARCKELDRVLGDILTKVMEKEMEIMVKLIQFVEKKIHCLDNILDLLAEFDAVSAMAATAADHNYVKPILTEGRDMEIIEGRHPLQELCVPDFVPNNFEALETEKRMKILTGPNACGKSVYLKQVALIVYMAHIGSFVPAASAKISIVREIFTRIQTVESVSTRLSAFMIDLRQMALALQRSSSHSLLVIDEFGKGTSELDGLALLAASLDHLLKRRHDCPLVLVSTHFHSVTDLLAARDSALLHKQTLDHLSNDKEVVYLHKLKDGGVTSSFAHQVAEAAGIDTSIINRASEVIEAMSQNKLLARLQSPMFDAPLGTKNTNIEELERHRQNFIAFMSLTDEDIEKFGHENVLELTKDI